MPGTAHDDIMSLQQRINSSRLNSLSNRPLPTMSTPSGDAAQAILSRLLEEHGLTGESRLFREAERKSFSPAGTPGRYRLDANSSPSESVVDVYGPGYVVQAEDVGPGLAFAEAATTAWQDSVVLRSLRVADIVEQGVADDNVEVEVRLEEVLRQGGLMYPVESVEVEKAWYFTLPEGSVEVRTLNGS